MRVGAGQCSWNERAGASWGRSWQEQGRKVSLEMDGDLQQLYGMAYAAHGYGESRGVIGQQRRRTRSHTNWRCCLNWPRRHDAAAKHRQGKGRCHKSGYQVTRLFPRYVVSLLIWWILNDRKCPNISGRSFAAGDLTAARI